MRVITALRFRIAASLLLVICICSFAGCGSKGTGIEGTWVLVEEYEADGDKVSGEELENVGISEMYEIGNGNVTYTLTMRNAKKPITMKMTLEEAGDNRYRFIVGEKITFAEAEVNGDTMTYYVGEGNERRQMVFKRQ